MHKCTYSLTLTPLRHILRVFKVLSDETRLRMGISQTRASRGLTALHNVGLLKARRDGLWVLYSIDEEEMKPYACITELIRNALEGNEVASLDRQRLRGAVRESPCVERAKVFRS
jgi:ArsR family transcriptional regulator